MDCLDEREAQLIIDFRASADIYKKMILDLAYRAAKRNHKQYSNSELLDIIFFNKLA